MIEYHKIFTSEPLFYINDNGLVCQEVFKDIRNYEARYQVSDLGRIKSMPNEKRSTEKILKQSLDRYGYLTIGLSVKSIVKRCTIHRLVAISFIPNPKNKPTVNHKGKLPNGKEGNKLDNRVTSLEWNTISENTKHSVINGLKKMPKGELSTSCKLTDEDIVNIRKELGNFSHAEIAKKYNVSRGLIYLIEKNKRRIN